ncbi:carbohydrate kinase family protein [Dactylosporangium sp. CA-092794]|uniref:carbohydrate kinase family protein n=1 Tax=Dactylosporangium sp. CA-092794 TaxID=3239929 RepID=UPI003D928EA6
MGRTVVTGSIATDHLMRFPGRFVEQLLPDQLHRVSLSFLVDDLVIRRGGVAANIAFGMTQLGERPILVGAVGKDFADHRSWLEDRGVDCSHLWVSQQAHTARFVCTTDEDLCQIASFYPGAMTEARKISLASVLRQVEDLDLVLIGADDPLVMLRHAAQCRTNGVPFAADPSQQLARMSGDQVVEFIRGANYLLTNEYEHGLLLAKTGCTAEDIERSVEVVVTTLGERGVRITRRDHDPIHVPAAKVQALSEPTGVGDAFRAGFFIGISRGMSLEEAGRVGCQLAVLALETVGTQEYNTDASMFCHRLSVSYGEAAAVRMWSSWPGFGRTGPDRPAGMVIELRS